MSLNRGDNLNSGLSWQNAALPAEDETRFTAVFIQAYCNLYVSPGMSGA